MLREPKPRVVVYRRALGHSETFILAQLRGLRRYRPHLFGVRTEAGLSLDDIRVHTLVPTSGGGALARMQELAFRYGGYGPVFSRTARRLRPSLIHAHFAMDGVDCIPLAESLKIPLMVTLHGWDVTVSDQVMGKSWSGRRYLSRRKRLQGTGSLFLCVSDFIRRQALSKGFPAEKLVVHYIGVDTDKLVPVRDHPRESIVLFVGRLVEKKRLTYLLRAMAEGGKLDAAVRLIVIGEALCVPITKRRRRN